VRRTRERMPEEVRREVWVIFAPSAAVPEEEEGGEMVKRWTVARPSNQWERGRVVVSERGMEFPAVEAR